jgi:hypothetical protein
MERFCDMVFGRLFEPEMNSPRMIIPEKNAEELAIVVSSVTKGYISLV